MLCSSCIHGVTQQVFDRDMLTLRDVLSCDLLLREMVRLVECSRYQEMKKGSDMILEESIEYRNKFSPESTSSSFVGIPEKRGRGNPNWKKVK